VIQNGSRRATVLGREDLTISFDAAHRLFLLATPATAYALRLSPDGAPKHVHWGGPLTSRQAAAVPAPADLRLFDLGCDEEIAIDGGGRFGPPSLQIRFPGGIRALEWHYRDHAIDGNDLAIRFEDKSLEIVLHYRIHDDSDVIERRLALRNGGTEDIEVLRADAAAWRVPVREDYRLSYVSGGWGTEFQLQRAPVDRAETVLTSRQGRTGAKSNPWVMLDAGTATEEHGEVWSAALAWSGSWRITVHRTHDGPVQWTGGPGHEGIGWRLGPGENWESPVFAGLYTRGGFGAASRGWHDYTTRHVLPRPDELRPVIYNSWEATGFDVTLADQAKLAELAAGLGTELFVVDDGWFGARTSDRAGLGDWWPNPERFPDGLGPLIEHVKKLGMAFGLWVEPEMVNPDSDLYRAHPDWVVGMPGRQPTLRREQLVLNFGRTEVTEWAFETLNALVGQGIDYLKWDMNRPFTEAGWPDERIWTDHVTGLYRVLDRLRAAWPGLRIQDCCSGGGRADLGILARTDEVWTSDNTDAVHRIPIQHGYSQVYPAITMGAWVTDSPNPITRRSVPLRFRFHVAMAGVLGLGGTLTEWSDTERAEAAELVAQYKEIRPVVQHGALYRLAAPGFTAVQYVLDDEVVVIGWQPGSDHLSRPSRLLRLAGLDPDADYRADAAGTSYPGAVLLAHGLPIEMRQADYASFLVRLGKS
jgi:alpha-galactosidase